MQVQHIQTHQGHQAALTSLLLIADMGLFVSGGADDALRIWQIEKAELRYEIPQAHGLSANLLRFPNMPFIVSAGHNGLIQFWNLESGEWVRDLAGHETPMHTMVMSPDGLTLVSLSLGGRLCVWDTLSGRIRYSQSVKPFNQHQLTICAAGEALLLSSESSAGPALLRVLDLQDGHLLREITLDQRDLQQMSLHPEGDVLLASADGSISRWDWQTGQRLAQWSTLAGLRQMLLLPHLDVLLLATLLPGLSLWPVGSRQGQYLPEPSDVVTALCASASGELILVGCEDGVIHHYSLEESTLCT